MAPTNPATDITYTRKINYFRFFHVINVNMRTSIALNKQLKLSFLVKQGDNRLRYTLSTRSTHISRLGDFSSLSITGQLLTCFSEIMQNQE